VINCIADLDDVFMDMDSDLSFTYSNDNESLVTVQLMEIMLSH
jgi:hypothetical protein